MVSKILIFTPKIVAQLPTSIPYPMTDPWDQYIYLYLCHKKQPSIFEVFPQTAAGVADLL